MSNPSIPGMSSISSPTGSTFRQMQRMEEYFINGGDLFLVVESYFYRVHSYFLMRESHKFSQSITKSQGKGEGNSMASAIRLGGCTPEEFNKFLWIFYNPKYGIFNAPMDDWAAILKLSHNWEFHEVKALAIRELQKLEILPVDRIALYEANGVDEALTIPFYSELCRRDYALDHAESGKLGMRATVTIFRAREALRARIEEGGKSPLPKDVDQEKTSRTIQDLLAQMPPPPPQINSLNGFANGLLSRPGSPFLG